MINRAIHWNLLAAFCVTISVCCHSVVAQVAPGKLTLKQPLPYQVVQRIGVAPATGYAHVAVRGDLPAGGETATWEYRTVKLNNKGAEHSPGWRPLTIRVSEKNFAAEAVIAAGGWYLLEVRSRDGERLIAQGAIEPIGVGEVFLVAGQSNATNCHDELQKVKDPEQRVVAFDSAKNTWRVANDPQPVYDNTVDGSLWPPLGDALAKELQVPIAFANVAVGATSSEQWLPEGKLHPRLMQVGKTLGNFRAILWQQGESDVIAKTTTEKYIANLRTIRDTAVAHWGIAPPWLLAKSTHHPTVYNDPVGEEKIRAATGALWKQQGFLPGPDTDTLRDENRGDQKSRRHFSPIGQQRAAEMWLASIREQLLKPSDNALSVGLAETDITPPMGFPMAGYYHERLAEGAIDPLKAKAIVFKLGSTQAALVACDLIGIAKDLSQAIREQASKQTGIPAQNIVIAGTHTHTAPDYMKELYLNLGGERQDPTRAEYIKKLISGPVEAIAQAHAAAQPAMLESGIVTQTTPVSFNRRFVMRDGSVRTWMNWENPDVIRAAGPIDPGIGLLTVRDQDGLARGVFSNFALHLDTVGGSKWSADYPYFIAQTLQRTLGDKAISIFGTGCCGDINHVNPRSRERNKVDVIGASLAKSMTTGLCDLRYMSESHLVVKSRTVQLPLEEATEEQVAQAMKVLDAVKRKEKVEFLDQVLAYKKLVLDHFHRREPYAKSIDYMSWGLSRSLAGIGDKIPVDVTVISLGPDFAIVCLPGEVFTELGLAIKQGSPFRTTAIVELSNCVETIYIPNRAAYAGGSYEVTNSAVQAGSGEMLVETALTLLREAASEKAKN